MIISQVVRIRLLQSVIPLPPISLPILPESIEKHRRAARSAHPHHPQTKTQPSPIQGRLPLEEHHRRGDPACAPQPNLHSRRSRPLVVAADEVGEPAHRDRLRGEAARHDHEEREVPDADADMLLGKEESVADRRDQDAEDGVAVAVPHAVCEVRRRDAAYGGDHVHGDRADLGLGGHEAHLV